MPKPRRKLTQDEARLIRGIYKDKIASMKEISKSFSMSFTAIRNLLHNKSYQEEKG
jgi:hypothetical protein